MLHAATLHAAAAMRPCPGSAATCRSPLSPCRLQVWRNNYIITDANPALASKVYDLLPMAAPRSAFNGGQPVHSTLFTVRIPPASWAGTWQKGTVQQFKLFHFLSQVGGRAGWASSSRRGCAVLGGAAHALGSAVQEVRPAIVAACGGAGTPPLMKLLRPRSAEKGSVLHC